MVMQTKVAKEFAELITDKQKKEALLKTIEREQFSFFLLCFECECVFVFVLLFCFVVVVVYLLF